MTLQNRLVLYTVLSAGILSLSALPASAQFTHADCPEAKAADFRILEVFNRTGANTPITSDAGVAEPVQFDLHQVKRGDALVTDVYFVERLGKVKYYDGAAKKLSTMGSIPTLGRADNGVVGIALHPNFTANRWMYIWYAPPLPAGAQYRRLRLSRFTATPQTTLDLGSEKIMIDIQGSKSDNWHSGGPMTFDSYGDLWVTIGNNSPDLDPASLNVMSKSDSTQSAEWGPSSTAGMRGGIIRIHPDSSTKGYSIPKGNFGEYWATQFEGQGKAALAAEYRNPAKVLPEIYIKGSRSNYSIWVHPTKRWVAWGEVNYASTNDEFNLVANPTFAGYPYFHRDNQPTGAHGMSPATPTNNSPFNNGVKELPPAVPGMINNLVNVAMGGPVYQFNAALDSKVKFPPHFHNTWATFAFSANQMHLHKLDSVQVKVASTHRVDNTLFAATKLRNVVQAKYGPEGALYILYYDGFYTVINPGIIRIEYAGTCNPVAVKPSAPAYRSDLAIELSRGSLQVDEAGSHEVRVMDIGGATRLTLRGAQGANYRLADQVRGLNLDKGIYWVQVITARGVALKTLSVL